MQGTVGFIGGGNMGSAIIGGIVRAGLVRSNAIWVSAAGEKTLVRLRERYGVEAVPDNTLVAQKADILFLALKPGVYPAVINEIREHVGAGCVVVSLAAGLSLAAVEGLFMNTIKIVRAMPNTPCLVGAGMTALCANSLVLDSELREVERIFKSVGAVEIVDEGLMDIVVGASGSAPAYVYMFMEAMADAAVEGGMPRAQAYRFVGQAVLGAAKMLLETGEHPGILKDQVCSPGGTTIAAVCALEEHGFRSATASAVRAAAARSREMGEENRC